MSPDFLFFAALIAKMAVTAAFVVTASIIAERAGPLVGAMVATLPISAGPAYVFLSLDHDAAFVSGSALASLAANAANAGFACTYAAVAQRDGVSVSLSAAFAVWFALTAFVQSVPWTLDRAGLFNLIVFIPCLLLSRRFRDAPMPFVRRRWYDLALRSIMVAVLIGLIVSLSARLGPGGSGMLAVFPVVLTSLILILHPRVGGPASAAVIANGVSGLVGFAIALAVLHVMAVPLGPAVALPLTLAICVGWNLMVWAARRRAIPI